MDRGTLRCAAKSAWPQRSRGRRRDPRGLAWRCLQKGLQAAAEGRQSVAQSWLLAAERAAGQTLAAAEPLLRGVPCPPAARRSGSLLMREVEKPGRCEPRAWIDPVEGAARAGDRFAAWLVGGEVPRVDCASEQGFADAMDLVARRVPVVMLNLDLMPATRKWDLDYLRAHCNEWPGMNVLRSDGDENRYLYYVPEQADRDMSAFQQAPRHASSDLRLSFEAFLERSRQDPDGRYYLQAPLVLRSFGEKGLVETWSAALRPELREDCEARVNWKRLEAIQAAGGFGHWSRSQLFVGPGESLSPVHYDQYDNIYLQVAGEKRFLLFDPATSGLYPFPVSHPYDEYAMVDLEHPDVVAFPELQQLRGAGAVASVKAGEAIFIPTHWWHHVQGVAAGAWSISVNFWFAIHRVLLEAPHPFPGHLELELARHVELLISDVAGSAGVGSMAQDLRQEAENQELAEDEALRPVRNFLLQRLQALLGDVAPFLARHFPAERFQRRLVQTALKPRKACVKATGTQKRGHGKEVSEEK